MFSPSAIISLLGGLLIAAGLFAPVLLMPIAMAELDFVTLARARFKRSPLPARAQHAADFTILIPIFGDIAYLKNVAYLAPYGDKVVLCTTNRESGAFNDALLAIAERYGFRIFYSEVVRSAQNQKTNPWGLFHKTLQGGGTVRVSAETVRDEMVRDGLMVVESEYCVFLDGDTITKDSVHEIVGAFAHLGYDLASVRVLASQERTMAERLQAIEYELAMDARRVYPWLTSGAGMVARTDAIRTIMRHHSLFFQGGDIEIGKLSQLLGMKVGHLPFTFLTDVPSTFRAWFKQRVAWCGGGFRHAVLNLHRFTWRHPFFFVYNTVVVYLLTPERWYQIVKHPWFLPIIVAIYWVMIFGVHWHRRRWFFFLFPFYALVQVMVIVPLGAVQYYRMAYRAANVGHIRLRDAQTTTAAGELVPTSPV